MDGLILLVFMADARSGRRNEPDGSELHVGACTNYRASPREKQKAISKIERNYHLRVRGEDGGTESEAGDSPLIGRSPV